MNDMVLTNIGKIPKEDYLDIKAMSYGFDSYEDMRKSGYIIVENENDKDKTNFSPNGGI